jgi:inner membrane protein
MDTQPALSFWQKNKLIIKSFFIAFLILALLIPTFIIMYLANERKERKQEVTREISNKWSAAQTITGPFLIVPYTENETNNGNTVTVRKNIYLLPDQLKIEGTLEPEIRYRSIYKVPVFTAKPVSLTGKFAKNIFNTVGVNPLLLKWNEAKLCIGITDLKGTASY